MTGRILPRCLLETSSGCAIADFTARLQPQYRWACLVGAPVARRTVRRKFGVAIHTTTLRNSGCLVQDGSVTCHEKMALVPLMEGLPHRLDSSFFRRHVLPFPGMTAPFTAGTECRILRFTDRRGQVRSIAVAVCYETHNPFLPQFSDLIQPDAIIHIANDGLFASVPGFADRQILACRSRAVETGTWNLLCSATAGSVVVDPRGRITARLDRGPGVLTNRKNMKI